MLTVPEINEKCYTDEPLAVLLDGLHIDDKLHFVEEPVEIMDREVKRLKQSRILIVKIKQIIQAARDRQKSYADLKRKPMEFQVGDRVMLKVSPWKGVVRFGKWGKLNPRYVEPFKVLEKVRAVAYKLELPQELSRVHNTFHDEEQTAQILPPVNPISIPIPETDVPKTLPKPNIPYPLRRNDQKQREKASYQIDKIFQIFQDLRFDISFADALLLMPIYH
ncbi:hypothetical protein Tco_1091642 [Tanacetum coccineum]|uniref:Tf2-1-like SH3-like domain-containing protein n=1 Tax=Tanacetum coccineum TaxID=301880 RepID=A0ABQ5I8T9_9ASTR